MLWSLLLWGVILLSYWLILKAFGLPFGPAEAIFVMGFAMIGSLVPTPGGAAGAFEAATAAGLMLLKIEKDQSAAVALITPPDTFLSKSRIRPLLSGARRNQYFAVARVDYVRSGRTRRRR